MKTVVLILVSFCANYSLSEETDTTLEFINGTYQVEQTFSKEFGDYHLFYSQLLLTNYKNVDFNLNYGNDTISKLSTIAIEAIREGDEKTAYANFNKALELAVAYKNVDQIASCYSNIGNFYIYKGMLNRGWKYTLISFTIAKKINNAKAISDVNFNIGLIYIKQKQHDNAINHLIQTLEIRESLKDTFGVSLALLNLSASYSNISRNELSLELTLRALELAKSLNKLSLINACYQNLEKIEYKLGHFEKSREYILKSIEISKTINNPRGLGNSYYVLAQFATDEEKHFEAVEFMKLSIEYSKKAGEMGEEIFRWKRLADIQIDAQNYKAAFDALLTHNTMKDSLEKIENQSSIEKLQLNYEKALSENELKLKEKEVQSLLKDKVIKYYIIIGLTVLTGLLIVIIILYLKKKKSQIEQGEIQKKLIVTENQILVKEKEVLNMEVEHSNKELLSFAITTANKNEIIQSLKNELDKAIQDEDVKHNSALRIKGLFKKFEHTEKDWSEFKMRFEKIEKDFAENLEKKHPSLSQSDIRICSLIKLRLSSKEISNILNITHESVNKSRYRLRKKLALEKEMSLNNFIAAF